MTRTSVATFLTILVLASGAAARQAPPAPIAISIRGALVSIRAHQAPPAVVLRDLARQGGFELTVVGDLPKTPLDLELESVALPVAFERILAGTGFGYVMSMDNSRAMPSRVLVGFSTGKGLPAQVATPASAPRSSTAAAPEVVPTPNVDESFDPAVLARYRRERDGPTVDELQAGAQGFAPFAMHSTAVRQPQSAGVGPNVVRVPVIGAASAPAPAPPPAGTSLQVPLWRPVSVEEVNGKKRPQ